MMKFTFIYLLVGIVHIIFASTIPDTEYEQVIAERYLFEPFANESTVWTVLKNINNIWQVVSLPFYHSQAAEGVWLLGQTNISNMFWMSISTNGTLVPVNGVSINSNTSRLIISHNKNTSLTYTAALISSDRIELILCNMSDATSCNITHVIFFPSILTNTSKITDGLFIEDLGISGWLYIATNTGLHGLDLYTLTIIPFLNEINVSVSSLARSSKRQTVFIGTETKLWIYSYNIGNDEWRFEHIYGLIDAPITSLVFNDAQDKLWIGQETGITLLSPIVMTTGSIHWYFSRLAGQISNPGSYIGHLPFANITVLSISHSILSDNRVWLGTIYGAMRYSPDDIDLNVWRVFNSPRYIPNRDALIGVRSLAVLSRPKNVSESLGSTAVVVTNKGLSVLRFEMWTLSKKAEHFQDFFKQSSRHDKYNLVSDCPMSVWGDSRSCVKGSSDNDGLWTSMYLSSQVFRYAVMKDPEVKYKAWTHFEALELLNKLTGIPGYPSRSFAKRSDFPPRHGWYLSPINSTLQFRGDTSSDEIVGHEFVYPLVYDLLADNDDERQRAYVLVFNITTHIFTHNWYLVGEKHNRTSWGIWNPIYINNDKNFQDDRGLNSLEILAYLLQTYAYSGDERFLDGAKLLIETYKYNINLINMKMISVCDDNTSDDELIYLSYFNLVYAINTITSTDNLSQRQKISAQIIIDQILEYMRIGLYLAHKYKQMEKSPFYNFIYCYVTGQVNQTQYLFENNHTSIPIFDCDSLSKDGIWYMQRWPLELINWPQFNSHRLDIQRNLPSEDHNNYYSIQMLPPDERCTHKWNDNIYLLDSGNGFYEEDPTAFLMSYWGMRFFSLLDT